MVVFCLGLEVVMVRGRRSRKSGGGELEGNKQNVATSYEAIVVLNVVTGDEVVGEPHVVALDATIIEQNITTSNTMIV
jgi:hypothetical protein